MPCTLPLTNCNKKPDTLLIDGNRFNRYDGIPHHCIIKADGKYLSIAAASILAKTYRDELMEKLHQEFPMYDWKKTKDIQPRLIEMLFANMELQIIIVKVFDYCPNS